jgi:hypothetical protein
MSILEKASSYVALLALIGPDRQSKIKDIQIPLFPCNAHATFVAAAAPVRASDCNLLRVERMQR